MANFIVKTGKPSAICKRLLASRHNRGLTIMDVARHFETNKSTVSRWEVEHHWRNFTHSTAKRYQLMQLAEYYREDYYWLLTGRRLKEDEISDIMIVDNQQTSLLIMSFYIQAYFGGRYNTKTFSRADAAARWAKTHDASLVLCDYLLPGMKGDRLIRKLKSLKHYHHTPFLSVTVYDEPGIRERLLNAGASDVLYKPLNERRLTAALKRL